MANAAALSIFDYERLAREDLIVYGDHTLDISKQVDALIRDGRAYLKIMVADSIPSGRRGV